MIVEQLRPEAMEGFKPFTQPHFAPPDWGEHWQDMIDNGWAWSVAFNDGRLAGACGLYRFDASNPRAAEMWAAFSADAGRLMVGVTRRTLAVLEAARGELDHIRAHVGRSFPHGRKWVLLLGFEPSGESFEGHDDIYDRFVWKG